ncbi:inositol-trisphosphate 3-kinase homolog isoform X1 [Parasteatoda tepidariorum]|uniref:inositol-trisphosphate 3-kinase homolog isoform X1 n=1 Tax=Parasteatoda tepidariorum TaxID=114398 RepID=UPI001C724A5D|nr:inositol-trisphosphate 3-kinase homolog isoform X1 [Parasteatoda tepidariorum]
MCKSSECSMKIFDSPDLEIALKQLNDLKMKFSCTPRELAAKKADNQAAELSNILRPKDKDNDLSPRKNLSRSRVHQFARNAFGSAKASVSKTNNTESNEGKNPDINKACPDQLTLLQLLALNALDLTAPASNVLLKNRLNNWVQLSGHEGSFAPAGPGTIWKKSSKDRIEIIAYEKLMKDTLQSMVPQFYKDVEYNNEYFIEMQDLLYNFKNPAVMDIKMGTRTFLESEVENSKARTDLYEKMIKVDPNAPTPEEQEAKAITKLRYMQFRENLSSSAELGFRIEGFKVHGQEPTKDLKLLRSRDEICKTMRQFLNGSEKIRLQVIARLQNLRAKLEKSPFFRQHEVIGSSILIIHDGKRAGAWMIDFAKTNSLPEGVSITHRSKWTYGNQEDGYLTGLDNLITVLKESGKIKNKSSS